MENTLVGEESKHSRNLAKQIQDTTARANIKTLDRARIGISCKANLGN